MPNPLENPVAAIAIDLGSTRFKLGCVAHDGSLSRVVAVPAPKMTGDGLIRETDAATYLGQIERLLDRYGGDLAGLSFGLVSQRSTFVAWDRATGVALTPVISWQDRRAADWCERHQSADEMLRRRCGLLMSPHYAGPKLAALIEDDERLADALRCRDALVGTLDAWLTWTWSGGTAHRTDLTMAARTAMVDIATGDWSAELLDLYGVPRAVLPRIATSDSADVPLANGLRLTSSIADQGAGVLAVLDPGDDAALVNLGTGGFVLRPVGDALARVRGYLTAPILSSERCGNRYVLEGTINGAGPAVDHYRAESSPLPVRDLDPDSFAIPDMTGVGAPHWRADYGLTLSAAAQSGSPAAKRRIVVEGLLFRIFEILRDLGDGALPDNIYLSGGLARDPGIAGGLASLLGRPISVFDEPEATLLGVARLAVGMDPFAGIDAERVEPSDSGAYLAGKFPRWQDWLHTELA